MMILQGVKHWKPYIGVCYANDPKKGGYTTLAPALDLTTSLSAKSSPARGHMGGADWGYLDLGPGNPAMG